MSLLKQDDIQQEEDSRQLTDTAEAGAGSLQADYCIGEQTADTEALSDYNAELQIDTEELRTAETEERQSELPTVRRKSHIHLIHLCL